MDVVSELVLKTLYAVHGIRGYNPTIGEIASIAMLSRGLVDRRLQRLADLGYVVTDVQEEGRVRYRFMPTIEAGLYFKKKAGV